MVIFYWSGISHQIQRNRTAKIYLTYMYRTVSWTLRAKVILQAKKRELDPEACTLRAPDPELDKGGGRHL